MNCRGDVVLVLFPDSNLRTSKRRPALVVQADRLGTDLPQTIVAMITSNMARAGHPSRVVVRAGGENARVGAVNGLRNHDRQSRHHSPFGNRSCHRALRRDGGNRRCIANDAGTTTWMSYACFPSAVVRGPERVQLRHGWGTTEMAYTTGRVWMAPRREPTHFKHDNVFSRA
jgi:mRNA-degrading endonuclease toxin of MazEF toxin-antitoxin module